MLRVEIADSPSKQARGLMFRRKLQPDEGMAFLFNKPQKLSFWGINTYIPLDIAYVNKDNRIVQISDIKPLSQQPVQCQDDCIMAIETNLDFFRSNKIAVGDAVKLNAENGEVFFEKGVGLFGIKQAQYDMDLEKQKRHQNLPILNPDNINQYIVDDIEDEYDQSTEVNIDNLEEPQIDIRKPDDLSPPDTLPDIQEPEDYPDFATDEEAIDWGSNHTEAMRITYVTKRGKQIQRDVEPHGQFLAKTTGNEILVTWDRTMGNIRAYIMDNIIYHQFLGDNFEPKFILDVQDPIRKIEKPENNPTDKIDLSGLDQNIPL